jgi:dTDP-4-dehydrorhamnose reductase
MTNARVLIFGRTGQLGWELRHKLACLGPVATVGSADVNFAKPETVREAISAWGPAVIVNAAAYTAVDKAESEPELAMAINGTAPGVLAEEAKRAGALLVHYSTDYVYDGSKQGMWVETDATNPLNVYGKTKLAGDEAIAAAGCDHLIFRTSWVYGARGNNFLLTMLRMSKERPELRVVDDQTGAPTSSECIAQATADAVAQVIGPKGGGLQGRSGVYHLACSGSTTWFGFAKTLIERSVSLGAGTPKMTPIPTSEFPRPATRPMNSRLSGARLEEAFGVRMPDWEDALALVLETLKDGAARV